jgi:hypothetical protein
MGRKCHIRKRFERLTPIPSYLIIAAAFRSNQQKKQRLVDRSSFGHREKLGWAGDC